MKKYREKSWQISVRIDQEAQFFCGIDSVVDHVNIRRSYRLKVLFYQAAARRVWDGTAEWLKEEIDVWKKKLMEELKNGGKEVKYDKIEVTQNEESSKEILGNSNRDQGRVICSFINNGFYIIIIVSYCRSKIN